MASSVDKQPDLRIVDGRAEEHEMHGELVAEVIRDAGILDDEKLEQARARVGSGTFSQALVEEGFASALGVARRLAEMYHLPLVDLAVAGVDQGAAKSIALPVLERVCAIPFASDGKTIKVAITDPQDVRGLDELKLATRLDVEFSVAARNDVLTELRRLGRAAEAMNVTFFDDAVVLDDSEDGNLEADDGISDAPLVRLVNSVIFQAAEDGASDIHVEPQEDELIVRYRIDGVLHVAHRVAETSRCRSSRRASKSSRSSTSPSAESRRTDASRSVRRRRDACSTSASRRCRRSRASRS